jgi:hypothetical protein
MGKKYPILEALETFARQRPGLDFNDYGEFSSYRSELRSITRDLRDVQSLLIAVYKADSMTEETLRGAFRAYSGRLTLSDQPDGGVALAYCTGQYWPTEYRKAVCAVLAAALWDHYREDFAKAAKDGESPGSAIRRKFREWFGRGIQSRWFD